MRFSAPISIAEQVDLVAISSGDKSCHLLVRRGSSLLINCLPGLAPADILKASHPLPEEIWHTQIDDSLAAEGDRFQATIRLPLAFAEPARASDQYGKDTQTTWDRPQDWSSTFGRERYGVAGSLIVPVLGTPLGEFNTFETNETLSWNGLVFEVVDLSVRNFYAVGFALKQEGKTAVLFSGEFVDGSGCLPDAHGFDARYSGPPWQKIADTLRELATMAPQWLFPAIGPPVQEPASLFDRLAARIDEFLKIAEPNLSPSDGVGPAPSFGRYKNHGDSVYQISNYGNVILLIDDAGFGLMIDPGPCQFEDPQRKKDFLADLEKFEAEAGLRAIDLVLVTHFHGDHYDLWPLVRERYPQCKLAAWRPVADVIEQPETYPYPCLLPWYKAGWEKCPVDISMSRKEPLLWHGTEIHTVHLPGHCFVHAGYWLDWRGRRILFSGDSIQTRGEVDKLHLNLSNHTVPGTEEGHGQAYKNVIPLDITLNLGGHSSHFSSCSDSYSASSQRIEAITAMLMGLFGDKDPYSIFLRPGLVPAAERVRRMMAES